MLTQVPYNIFPWSPQPHASESSPWWLVYHVVTSLWLLYSARGWHISSMKNAADQTVANSIVMKNHHVMTMGLFSMFAWGVILNLFRLGALSPYMAFAVNTGALIGLSWAMYTLDSRMFFILLNAPVFLELFKLSFYIINSLNPQMLVVIAVFCVVYFALSVVGPLMGAN
jgi:hypothetical protein